MWIVYIIVLVLGMSFLLIIRNNIKRNDSYKKSCPTCELRKNDNCQDEWHDYN